MPRDADAAAANSARKPQNAADAIVVGRKRVPIGSAVLDAHCEQVVRPFDLKVNSLDLAQLAATGAADMLPNLIQQGTGDSQVAASTIVGDAPGSTPARR